MNEPKTNYRGDLESLGFYVGGRPGPGMFDAETLRAASRSSADAQQIDRSFKYASVLDAKKLGVTDIYELDGSTCIYFKSVDNEPSEEQVAQWHKAAWNHGLARMLWVCTPTQIRVFNAFAPPPENLPGLTSRDVQLFRSISSDLEELKSNRLARQRIESGEFWFGAIGKRIDRQSRVDEKLVEDLTSAAANLVELGLDDIQAHRLLLRTVFIAYLEAKGILPDDLFEGLGVSTFEQVLSSVSRTRSFFSRMKETFNGDLFPPPPKGAKSEGGTANLRPADVLTDDRLISELTAERLRVPRYILQGTGVKSRQRSFSFSRYDFGIIPIELISSIYEKFIHTADAEGAHQAGTHYTPVNLVDFVLSQVFDDGLFEKKLPVQPKVLDLSCGSGVFLVESLRRLIARRLAAGENHTRDLVRDTLYNQVYGIDIEETAIEIAAFSLCLTAFELDPAANSRHQLKFKHPLKGRTLFVSDAFDPNGAFHSSAVFADKAFDVVVGNPPWTRPKGPRSVSPSGVQRYVEYCRQKQPSPITLPFRDPPDQAFVWRAADFARSGARIGMILEGKRFFSQEDDSLQAKRELLRSLSTKLLVNFAALHDQKLFPSAKQPAIVLIAANRPLNDDATFPFVSVEFLRSFRKHGILQIGPENVTRISASLAASNPVALKVATWGSARDMALINRLTREIEDTLQTLLVKNNLELRQGFIEGEEKNRTRKVPSELLDLHCLVGGEMPPFEVSGDRHPKLRDKYLQRPADGAIYLQWPRDAAIYKGPLLLFASGLYENRIAVALCREDLVYSRSQFGIPLKTANLPTAYYLNGILNSSLATYFAFLTATRWGLDKYVMEETDFLRIPVPETDLEDSSTARRIVEIEHELRRAARNGKYDDSLVADLDKAVFELYGLNRFEQTQVEDMVDYTIDLQRNHERSKALEAPTANECRLYAQHVLDVIQPFLETRKKRRIVADILDVDAPLRVVRFTFMAASQNDRASIATEPATDLSRILEDIAENLDAEIAFGIHTRRHLRVSSGDSIYIVKPSQRRFWTRSAGLTDGDSILKDLLGKGSRG
jgi:hypothetical protein